MPTVNIAFEQLSSELRIGIAKELTDPAVLDQISYDSNEDVRRAVAFNRFTSDETLTRLRKSDPAGLVRDIATNTLWDKSVAKAAQH